MEISIGHIDFTSLDLSQIIELVDFHNSYYGTSRKPEHWIWQYKTYEPSKAVFTTARHNGKLIATQAMMPIYMKVGDEPYLTGKSENTLLLPEYRGKKIMEDLYEYAVDLCRKLGIEFIWGFTPAAKAFRKFGFSVTPLTQTYWRPGINFFMGLFSYYQKPNPIWRKIAAMGKYGLEFLINIRRLVVPKMQVHPGYQEINERINLSQLNELFSKLNEVYPGLVSPHMDDKYIEWRIRNHPLFQYHEYQVRQNEELLAYAFVANFEGSILISDIASIAESATTYLLQRIVMKYRRYSGRFIFMINPKCCSQQNTVKIFNKFGFKAQSTNNLVFRDLSPSGTNEIPLDKWNITGLWTEGYSM